MQSFWRHAAIRSRASPMLAQPGLGHLARSGRCVRFFPVVVVVTRNTAGGIEDGCALRRVGLARTDRHLSFPRARPDGSGGQACLGRGCACRRASGGAGAEVQATGRGKGVVTTGSGPERNGDGDRGPQRGRGEGRPPVGALRRQPGGHALLRRTVDRQDAATPGRPRTDAGPQTKGWATGPEILVPFPGKAPEAGLLFRQGDVGLLP